MRWRCRARHRSVTGEDGGAELGARREGWPSLLGGLPTSLPPFGSMRGNWFGGRIKCRYRIEASAEPSSSRNSNTIGWHDFRPVDTSCTLLDEFSEVR